MDRTEDNDKLDETADEPVEQEDSKEDIDTPGTISVRIKSQGNLTMNPQQFANTMAIGNMINKQERDLLANQGGEETHNKAELEGPVSEAWGMMMIGDRMIPASVEQLTNSMGLWLALQNAHLQRT